MLRDFEQIYAIAAQRKGGADALEQILAQTPSQPVATIAAMSDDRVLAAITRAVFAAGFSWRVVNGKWAGFEAAFEGFDPHACAFLSDERIDALVQDRSIVRSPAKILSVRANAQLVLDLAAEHGSAARFLADWPDERCADLLDLLRRRGKRLGGETGARVLRALGKPAFIASPDMMAALIREGVLDRPSKSKRDMALVQAALNEWVDSWGRDLTVISRVLSMSVGAIPVPEDRPWEAFGL